MEIVMFLTTALIFSLLLLLSWLESLFLFPLFLSWKEDSAAHYVAQSECFGNLTSMWYFYNHREDRFDAQ